VSQRPGGRGSEAGLFPQRAETNGIVAAGIEAVDVEDLDRVAEFVVVAARMVSMLDLLEPDGKGLSASVMSEVIADCTISATLR